MTLVSLVARIQTGVVLLVACDDPGTVGSRNPSDSVTVTAVTDDATVFADIPIVADSGEPSSRDGDSATVDAVREVTTTAIDALETSEPRYFALVVDDSEFFDGRCVDSASGAHGADIDTVELITRNDDSYYFGAVDYEPGTKCTIGDNHDNPSEVQGPPNGSLTDGFVSLGGGYVAGEFGSSAIEILAGSVVVVYEIGDPYCIAAGLTPGLNCVGSEGYHVYIAEQLSCIGVSSCSVQQISGSSGAKGESEFLLSGF